MIVADTSALITVASIDILGHVLTEFDVHITETVLEELEDTAEYEDVHGEAARDVLNQQHRLTIHETSDTTVRSSRIDEGEGTTVELANGERAEFLITDDLRALPELQTVTDANVVISPIVLQALVKRDVLDRAEALTKVEEAVENRDWLGRPIYRRAQDLFTD